VERRTQRIQELPVQGVVGSLEMKELQGYPFKGFGAYAADFFQQVLALR
jgi:hypothetical protein